MSDSTPPSARGFVSRVMGVKELIIAVTGLVVAVASIFVPASTRVTQNAYEEMSKEVQEVSSATARNHDDIIALRGYLDGLRGTTLVVSSATTIPSSSTSPSMFSSLIGKPPMPPFIGPKPKTQNPPSFEQIKAKR